MQWGLKTELSEGAWSGNRKTPLAMLTEKTEEKAHVKRRRPVSEEYTPDRLKKKKKRNTPPPPGRPHKRNGLLGCLLGRKEGDVKFFNSGQSY